MSQCCALTDNAAASGAGESSMFDECGCPGPSDESIGFLKATLFQGGCRRARSVASGIASEDMLKY